MKSTKLWEIALATEPSEIPMKMVPDYEQLYGKLLLKKVIVLECPLEEQRTTSLGSMEAPNVKAFNNHVRMVKKRPLRTKRISPTRWACYLGDDNETLQRKQHG